MYSDINDPTAIKALLDQLGASQAWQDTLNSSSSYIGSDPQIAASEPPASTLEDVQGERAVQSSDIAAPASVASLLSQLRTSTTPVVINTPPVSSARTAHQPSRNIAKPSQELSLTSPGRCPPQPVVPTSSTHDQDTRSMTFQQALPHLTQLASDPGFLAVISRLRQEQNDLEQQLWEERQGIHKRHEEKVKIARTKATLIGVGLSKHEADVMNDAYRKDLRKFDRERVLFAWDTLIQKQQAALESLGVPTMFPTTSQANYQKQRKVVQVLEGL